MTDKRKRKLAVPVDESDHVRGEPKSRVTLLVYSDFDDPRCAETYKTVQKIRKKMGKSLRYVYRSFPGTRSVWSQLAAEAAECAGAQGKFWEMHDRLFEDQKPLGEFRLARHAANLGLDVRKFQRELVGHVHAARIRSDVAGGVQSGVDDTPVFFINSLRHESAFGTATLFASVQAANAS